MQIFEKELSEIKPYENNPRNNDNAVSAVVASICEFGFKVPIVIDSDGVIVCGHTRYKAAQEIGLKTVPCVIADDLTPEQVKAFRLADNKVGELATWDFEKLELETAELETIELEKFGFDSSMDVGLDGVNLDDLFTDAPEKAKEPKMIKCPHCGEMFEKP
jgi:site-specific DNA-methyltransferase (adenine-specific)